MNDIPRNVPVLSIGSTNYNGCHALRHHLSSIYDQFDENSFDYVCVDNYSRDGSEAILREWQAGHPNFRWVRRRCSTGQGREIAVTMSSAPRILIVDTDTVYFPILHNFVDRTRELMPEHAVQAIYAGVFPRSVWFAVGGRRDLNVGEDFDMWMRIWKVGRMKWYPVPMGENWKELESRNAADYLSQRYPKRERLLRFFRGHVDQLRLHHYSDLDLDAIWR